jgi:hypothetical protein
MTLRDAAFGAAVLFAAATIYAAWCGLIARPF